MGNRILNNKRGQSTIESAVVFIMIIILFAGLTQIWFWMNNQIVQRQQQYNATRVQAGKASKDYRLQWPVSKPPALNENDVLIGN